MRKKKDIPVIENFEITGVAAEGKSLGRWNDLVVFIPFGAPGDVIDLKIDRKKHSYAEGHIERLVKPSPLRVEPMCEHFGLCGGCKWQHLPYEYQLQCKQQQVVDAMERIAKVPIPAINPILGSATTTHYRNKLEFTFSNKCWLTREQLDSGVEFPDRNAAGFHIPGAFDKVLDIKRCWLQDDISNEMRLFIRNHCVEKGYSFYDIRGQQGFIRMTMTRTASTGEVMEVIVFGEDNQAAIDDVMSAVRDRFPQSTSLLYVVNLKVNDSLADQEFIAEVGGRRPVLDITGIKNRSSMHLDMASITDSIRTKLVRSRRFRFMDRTTSADDLQFMNDQALNGMTDQAKAIRTGQQSAAQMYLYGGSPRCARRSTASRTATTSSRST
ncbi:MAG: hypothetical protein IJ879_02785 [Muribaculaceae bacterium]|nr:hypothetical protein [Muribaculaceae bacterium]